MLLLQLLLLLLQLLLLLLQLLLLHEVELLVILLPVATRHARGIVLLLVLLELLLLSMRERVSCLLVLQLLCMGERLLLLLLLLAPLRCHGRRLIGGEADRGVVRGPLRRLERGVCHASLLLLLWLERGQRHASLLLLLLEWGQCDAALALLLHEYRALLLAARGGRETERRGPHGRPLPPPARVGRSDLLGHLLQHAAAGDGQLRGPSRGCCCCSCGIVWLRQLTAPHATHHRR